jgi:hypothetical protein
VGATLRTLVCSLSTPFLINASVRLYEVSELKPAILEPWVTVIVYWEPKYAV